MSIVLDLSLSGRCEQITMFLTWSKAGNMDLPFLALFYDACNMDRLIKKLPFWCICSSVFSLKLCLCWFSTCFRLLWICLKLLLCYFEGSPYCKPPSKFEPFSKLSFFPFFFRILALVKSFFCITFYRTMIQPCSNKWNESIEKDSRFEPAKNRSPYCKPLP